MLGIDTNDIPWAAIGGFLVGIGSLLSGWAALKSARDRGKEDAREESDAAGGK